MTTVLVSGATGFVGRYIVEGLFSAGHNVISAGRTPPPVGLFSQPVEFVPLFLDPQRDQRQSFAGVDAFIHGAFNHVPGRYRGGEGEDPEGFRRSNVDGTVRLFEEAKGQGVRHAIFLSSRAVYDGLPAGTALREDMALSPSSLYGKVKLDVETALARLSSSDFATASLRLTGVYGDLRPNKWDALFDDYRAGRQVLARGGTEVHGRDVASAVRLLLDTDTWRITGRSFNLSDLLLDTRRILERIPAPSGAVLPAAADTMSINIMDTQAIRSLGWRPGGEALFAETISTLAACFSGSS
jgi:nucleoside-diphosphate-sugar epimerase